MALHWKGCGAGERLNHNFDGDVTDPEYGQPYLCGHMTNCMPAHAGLRLGMYAPLKTAFGADTDPTILKKVAAGSASGAIATLITNPIELLKTRLQSCSTMGPLQVIKKVVKQDGVSGLWKGTMPSAVRP